MSFLRSPICSALILLAACGTSEGRSHDAGAPITDAAADARADAAKDASTNGSGDSGDSGGIHDGGSCTLVPFPLRFGPEANSCAERQPLDVYCLHNSCPASLAKFSERFVCDEDDAGFLEDDGGLPELYATRREGCGSVVFDVGGIGLGLNEQFFDFDAKTGALLGAAEFDDVTGVRSGCTCNDEGEPFGGQIRQSCAKQTTLRCRGR